jgi:hypothetical protein
MTAADWVAQIERRIRALSERAMRMAVLAEMLGQLDAGHAVSALGLLVDRAKNGATDARRVLGELALERDIFKAMPYAVRSVAYTRARKVGRDDVASLLLVGPISGPISVAEASTDNDYASDSVGQRCSHARSRDRFRIDRLLHDKDYRVIRVLLNNPILVERDVVKIAAMRPTRPDVLAELANHRKWASRYSVRKALAANPHTPSSVARRLLATLLRQDLVQLVGAGSVRSEVREVATDLLSKS